MTTTLRHAAALIAASIVLGVTLTACGGRPSADGIAAAMRRADATLSTKQAHCFGTALNGSGLSDAKLTELVKSDDSTLKDFDEADKAAVVAAFKQAASCVGVDPSAVPTDIDSLF